MTRHVENDTNASPPQAPHGARMSADDRRRQIAEVAMRLFAERGFRGTTTKEIAQAAGVSEAIIFRHFATKEELYTAIIDYKGCAGAAPSPVAGRPARPDILDEIRGVVAEAMEAGDDFAVFRNAALHMLDRHEGDPEFLRLLMYIALENHSLVNLLWDKDPARRIFRVTNEEAARQFAEILLRGIAADPDSVGAKRAQPRGRRRR